MSKKEIRDKDGNVYVEKHEVPDEIIGPDGKTYIRKKPWHKRWYFWVILIPVILFALTVLLAIIASIMASPSSSSEPATRAGKVAKSNWKNNRLIFKDGSFTITEKYRSERYEEDEAGKRDYISGGVMLIGTFKNKSNKSINVTKFMDKHLKVRSLTENGEWLLEPISYSVAGSGSKQLMKQAEIEVQPHQSQKCGVNFDGESGKNIPNDIYFKIYNNGKKVYETDPKKLETRELVYKK